jgi:hypothetical protein
MIIRQVRQRMKSNDAQYVHPVKNFAWAFPYVNIHQALVPDLLHQLHKGVVKHSNNWLIGFVNEQYGKNPKKATSGISRLDQRYRLMPHFPGLKIFNHTAVSKIQQWTGREQRALLRQMVAAYAPLLSGHPDVLRYLRAVCEFVLISHYHSHDEDTIAYIMDALERIDTYKWELKSFRPAVEDKHKFNIPKFHAITHYPWFIRQYGPLPGYDPGTFTEAPHMYLIKVFFSMTNKKQTLEQITAHNMRLLRQQCLEAVLTYDTDNQMPDILPNTMRIGKKMDIARTGWYRNAQDEWRTQGYLGVPAKTCITVRNVSEQAGMGKFCEAVAVFLREERLVFEEQVTHCHTHRAPNAAEALESDSSWVDDYIVTVRPCLRFWKPTGHFDNNPSGEETEFFRCTPNWQGRGEWLQHFAWMQEYAVPDTNLDSDPLHGTRLGQVKLIFTLADPMRPDHEYACMFMRMLQPVDNGNPSAVHGMIRMRHWSGQHPQSRRLGRDRCFNASQLLRSAHVVPSDSDNGLFVNNYVDFNEFNSIYRADWYERNQADLQRYREQNSQYFEDSLSSKAAEVFEYLSSSEAGKESLFTGSSDGMEES